MIYKCFEFNNICRYCLNFLAKHTFFQDNLATNSNRTVVIEPSPMIPVITKVFLSMICVIVFVKFSPMFPIESIKEEHFLKTTTLAYKLWYLSIITTLVRFKYYFAWTLADAVCNNSGIGFNGYNSDGSPNWNKFANINIIKFEVSFADLHKYLQLIK